MSDVEQKELDLQNRLDEADQDSSFIVPIKRKGVKAIKGLTFDDVKQVIGEDGLTYTYLPNGKLICGAKKKNGTPCQKSPINGRNRCRLHGGASPRGIAHPRFKTGRYSKDLPSRLSKRYEEAKEDEKLLELRDEIAILESRIGDLLSRTDSGESGATWRAAQKTFSELRVAAQTGDQAKFAELLNDLGRIIGRGVSDYAAWDEVVRTIERRRKLAESERKRLIETNQMISSEQAMGMLGFVVSVIKKHVTDDQTLAAISADIHTYLANRN